MFNDTIYYNIAYGDTSATADQVYEAAKKAHIHDSILSMPDGTFLFTYLFFIIIHFYFIFISVLIIKLFIFNFILYLFIIYKFIIIYLFLLLLFIRIVNNVILLWQCCFK